jgi:inner membrane protein
MKTMFRMNANSAMIKAAVIGVLVLVMLIPINMVKSLIYEREENRETVYEDISSKWGGYQCITGPVLVLPFEKTHLDKDKNEVKILSHAYFLPDNLNIDGVLAPEDRKRGIYNILVYQSDLKISGKFNSPDLTQLDIKPDEVKWEEATMMVGIPYMQGIKNKVIFNINGESMAVEPGTKNSNIITSGLTIKVPMDDKNLPEVFNFDFNLSLNGTEKIHFSPIGKETHANIQSEWGTVSFSGDFLPSKHNIETNNFNATWDIFDYNRNYSQSWVDTKIDLNVSTFGVDLKYPVNQYQMSMRSVKYAIMFIALTFVVFFLVELLSRKRIHPIQYLLVSFGLVLFYSLLVSLSEHINFNIAYLISSVAIILLISIYSKTIFKNIKQAGMMALFLIALYLYLYVILQLEDMSLLFGSVGLFIALAIIMYVSRKINWYKNEEENEKNHQFEPENNEIDNISTPPPFNPNN